MSSCYPLLHPLSDQALWGITAMYLRDFGLCLPNPALSTEEIRVLVVPAAVIVTLVGDLVDLVDLGDHQVARP
jgi:hypothetical protein